MAVLTIDTQLVQTTSTYSRVRVIVYATGPIEAGETGSVIVYGTTRNVVNDASIQMTESREDGTIEIYNELLNINARNGSYGGRAALIKAQLGTSKKEILQAFNCYGSVDVFIYPTETGKIYYGDTINLVVSQSNNGNSSASVIARCAKVDTSQYYPNNSKNFASITIMSNRTTTGVVQWTIPNTWLNYITDKTQVSYINGNAKSGSVLFEVEAIAGIAAILGLDMTPTIYVPESIVPVIGDIAYKDETGLGQPDDGAINAFIQNVSSVEAWAPISGQYGAQIRTVKAFYGEKNVIRQVTSGSVDIPDENDPFELGSISQTGDMTLTITATDSRGRSSSKSIILRTSAYTTPVCVFQAQRWNVESAHESDYSTVVRLTASGQISIVNNYSLSATLTIQGRQKGVEAWTTIGTASISGNYNEIFTKTDQSVDEIYEYQIIVIDELGFSITSTSGVGKSTPILEFHASGKGMGIGTVAPENGLAIELPITGSGLYPVGSVIIRYDHISPASLYGGVWERIEGRFLYATGASGTIGATGGSGTHTLTVDEIPAHRHGWYGVNSGTTVTTQMGTYPFDIEQDKKSNWNGTSSMIANTGGGKAHNNNPAFINVSVWRRVE